MLRLKSPLQIGPGTGVTGMPADHFLKFANGLCSLPGQEKRHGQTIARLRVVRMYAQQPRPRRTSQVLRDILAKNPDVDIFTMKQIAHGLGDTSFGTALMFFTIPEVIPIPIPGIAAIVVLPTLFISGQMVAGSTEIKLPEFHLKRTVPRQALERAMPRAIATFIVAFGLVENDGLPVVLRVVAGLLSLALLGGVVFGLFSFLGLGI